MIKAVILFFQLMLVASSFSQPCTEEALLKIPGVWKGPGKGSIHNVTAADLAKEREVLINLTNMLKDGYSPMGCNIVYSHVFGYNSFSGKGWVSDPYSIAMYVMSYRCHWEHKDISKKYEEGETPTSVNIFVNQIWSHEGRCIIYAADLPDDHHYAGYHRVNTYPEKKDGYYKWKILEATDRYPQAEYLYLLTYEGKLPFKPFTRREYLEVKIPMLKKFIAELERHMNSIDTTFDRASKDGYQSSMEYIKEKKKLLATVEGMLTTLTPAELAEGAIISAGESDGEFEGFKNANDSYINFLIKPDISYYNKSLPKWVPQFICIDVSLQERDIIYEKNIADIEKAIDFEKLRKMLGSSSLPASQAKTPSSVANVPSSSIQMSGGTKPGSSKKKYNIYQNVPTAGFKPTPVEQIKNAAIRPIVNAQAKTKAMSLQITSANRQEHLKKLLFDIESNLTTRQKKNTAGLLALTKSDPVDLADLGVMLNLKGAVPEALWCLSQAAALKPGSDYILNNLCGVLTSSGAAYRSLPFLRQLAIKLPRNTTVLNNLGQAWYALGESQKSKSVLDSCLKFNLYHPQANYTRAVIAEGEGKNAESAAFIQKSLKGSYNPSTEELARKKGIKIDYGNTLNLRRPSDAEYISAHKYLPPPQCTEVKQSIPLHAEWEAWSDAITQVSEKIHAGLDAAAMNYENETSKIRPGSSVDLGSGMMNQKAARIYLAFFEKLSVVIGEADEYIKTKYEKEKESIEKNYEAGIKRVNDKYAAMDGEGGSDVTEARCKEMDAISNIYLRQMAALNDDFNDRFSAQLRDLRIELMYWSRFMPEPQSMRDMRYYENALFAVQPQMMFSEFVEPCGGADADSKKKQPDFIPEPYCPISFKFKVVIAKVNGDCNKFELELEIPTETGVDIVFNYERDFVNKKTTLALGVGASLDLANKGDNDVSLNEKVPEWVPAFSEAGGAGVGVKGQGFIEFGPDGSVSDIGGRVEGGVEGVMTDKGDIKIGGKIGVNSGIEVTATPGAQAIVEKINSL